MINFNQIEDSIFIGSAPQNDLDVARLAKMALIGKNFNVIIKIIILIFNVSQSLILMKWI